MVRAKMGSAWRWVFGGILGAAAMVGMLSGVEAAPPGSPGGAGRHGARLLTPEDREAISQVVGQRIQERLGLSQEQWEDIRAMLRSTREKARADFMALRQARRELRLLLANPTIDPAALQATTDRIKASQGAILDRRIETNLALRGKLAPEQWELWQTLRRGRGNRARF